MSITVKDLDLLCEYLAEKEKEAEMLEDKLTDVNKDINQLNAKITNYLKDLNREEYDSPHGKVKIVEKWSVNLPDSDINKVAFFNWLREKGIFERYATVNSRSLQSLFKAEWDAAKARGEGMEFALPGINPAKLFEKTEFKAKKG